MIAQRNIALYVFLSFVTSGLQGLVWSFPIGGDIARLRGDGKPNALISFVLWQVELNKVAAR
jgi:hypothetical protein